jgi:hypothetical protein
VEIREAVEPAIVKFGDPVGPTQNFVSGWQTRAQRWW